MFRAVVEEAAALASLALFLGMIAIWANVIATLRCLVLRSVCVVAVCVPRSSCPPVAGIRVSRKPSPPVEARMAIGTSGNARAPRPWRHGSARLIKEGEENSGV